MHVPERAGATEPGELQPRGAVPLGDGAGLVDPHEEEGNALGARALQRRMPNCDVYLFSRTGHWVQWERAIEFNACVAAFLLAGEPAGDNAKDEG